MICRSLTSVLSAPLWGRAAFSATALPAVSAQDLTLLGLCQSAISHASLLADFTVALHLLHDPCAFLLPHGITHSCLNVLIGNVGPEAVLGVWGSGRQLYGTGTVSSYMSVQYLVQWGPDLRWGLEELL